MVYRRWANRSLILLLIVFCGSLVFNYVYPNLFLAKLLQATVIAGIVGGVADWFAVTALFRKPFGLAIPHTAIIPNNREKLTAGIAQLVQNELITVEMLKQQLYKVHLVKLLVQWLEKKAGSKYVGELVTSFVYSLLKKVNSQKAAQWIENTFKNKVSQMHLTEYVEPILQWGLELGEVDKLLSIFLLYLQKRAHDGAFRQYIYDQLKSLKDYKEQQGFFARLAVKVSEHTNAVNLAEAADAINSEILMLVDEVQSPQHELRVKIREIFMELSSHLHEQTFASQSIENWKNTVIERIQLEDTLADIIDSLIERLRPEFPQDNFKTDNLDDAPTSERSILTNWVMNQVNQYWDLFRSNQPLQDRINRNLTDAFIRMIQSEHQVIGEIVTAVMNSLTDELLSQFIEDKTGNDLQWIRINGCMVGCIFGCTLYLLSSLLLDPISHLLV